MTLQQIEAICSIAQHRYNISAAANALHRSQSGLSRRIKELETELGTQIFRRTRNKVIGLTVEGERLLRVSQRILQDVKSLEQIATEGVGDEGGEIRVATSHIHARYLLPDIVKVLKQRFPRVTLTLQQCDPAQCRELIAAGEADVGISTITAKATDTIVAIPAYKLPRCVVVPKGHPLTREKNLTLKKLAQYPLISNPTAFIGRSILDHAFAREGLKPTIACSVTDADVCKTYVGIGMGIGVLATLAFDAQVDHGLVAIKVDHLLSPAILNVVLRRHHHLNRSLETFLSVFAPHLGRELLLKAIDGGGIEQARLSQRAPVASRKLQAHLLKHQG